jgi:hypothetical protein
MLVKGIPDRREFISLVASQTVGLHEAKGIRAYTHESSWVLYGTLHVLYFRAA